MDAWNQPQKSQTTLLTQEILGSNCFTSFTRPYPPPFWGKVSGPLSQGVRELNGGTLLPTDDTSVTQSLQKWTDLNQQQLNIQLQERTIATHAGYIWLS